MSQQLAEQANALPPLLTALAGLHGYHAARAQLTDSARIVPRMIELAERMPLPQAALVAQTCAAWLRWNQGELARAREHAIQAIAAKPAEAMSFPSTFDLVGYAFGTAAFVEMTLGNMDAARDPVGGGPRVVTPEPAPGRPGHGTRACRPCCTRS